jgi:hypothetical protein
MVKARDFGEAGCMGSVRSRARPRRLLRRAARGAGWPAAADTLGNVEPLTSSAPAARSSLDAGSTRALESGPPPAETKRARPMSLLWWVFLANGAVLIVALLLLTLSPIEIDAPIKIEQFALLLAGFFVLVGLDLVLLRRVLSPLFRPR